MSEERMPGALGSNDVLGLAARLRHEAWHTKYKPTKPWDLLNDAADEIERAWAAHDAAVADLEAHAEAEVRRAVAAERERCAKVAEGAQHLPNDGQDFANGWCSAALQIAQAIRRSRSERT